MRGSYREHTLDYLQKVNTFKTRRGYISAFRAHETAVGTGPWACPEDTP